MFNNTRVAFFWFTFFFLFACKKDSAIKNEDNFVEQPEQLSELKAEISAAGNQFLEVQWKQVNNTHFKAVTYSIYLDGQKIIDGLAVTKYRFINLNSGQSYAVKIKASTKDGKEIEQTISGTTLSPSSDGHIYQEYSIHSYSWMSGNVGLQKLSDEGHLVVRFLQHPDYFAEGTFKIIVFRTDKSGHMLWYRLLSSMGYEDLQSSEILLATHNQEKESLIVLQDYVIKFTTSNGDILLKKRYTDNLNGEIFRAVYATPNELIIGGEQGSLLSVNPVDLSLNWLHTKESKSGLIMAINLDSKKNICYILRELNDDYAKIRVHKCDAKGEFLKEFSFDGALPDGGNLGGDMTRLLIDEQDNFYLFGGNSSFYRLNYLKFSADGKVLKKDDGTEYLWTRGAFFNEKGEIVVTGQVDRGGLNTFLGLYVFDKDMNIKSKNVYTDIPAHIARGVTSNLDGSYNIFLDYMQTYTYDNSNFIFIKTDTNGKL